jgi:hypothetical protein
LGLPDVRRQHHHYLKRSEQDSSKHGSQHPDQAYDNAEKVNNKIIHHGIYYHIL